MTTQTKTCTKCGETKGLGEFYRDLAKTNGLSSRCRQCCKKQSVSWQRANPQRAREIGREADKKWARRHPEKVRDKSRRRQHRRDISPISDRYVTRLLFGTTTVQAPPTLINLKREQIRLHRLVRQLEQATTEQQENLE